MPSLVSPGTKLLADEKKATKRPPLEIAGEKLNPLAWAPPELTLTRSVVPCAQAGGIAEPSAKIDPRARAIPEGRTILALPFHGCLDKIFSGYALAAGAQSRIAWTVGDATGPWQLVGEQVLIGPVTVPAAVRNRIALDPSTAPKSAVVVTRWLPSAGSVR
jgi:hypothetical protein